MESPGYSAVPLKLVEPQMKEQGNHPAGGRYHRKHSTEFRLGNTASDRRTPSSSRRRAGTKTAAGWRSGCLSGSFREVARTDRTKAQARRTKTQEAGRWSGYLLSSSREMVTTARAKDQVAKTVAKLTLEVRETKECSNRRLRCNSGFSSSTPRRWITYA